jgi:hypothetical protein
VLKGIIIAATSGSAAVIAGQTYNIVDQRQRKTHFNGYYRFFRKLQIII